MNTSQMASGLFPKIWDCQSRLNPTPLKHFDKSSISPSEMILLFTLILTAVPDKSLVYREMCGHSQLPREGAYLVSH